MASRLRLREVRREDRNVDKLEKERPYWEENNNMRGMNSPYMYNGSDHRCERQETTEIRFIDASRGSILNVCVCVHMRKKQAKNYSSKL